MNDINPRKLGVIVVCTVCGHQKAPIGRSAPLGMYLCDWECPGYRLPPFAGSLWPGESEADFGYPVGNDGVKDVT